jgi:tRNA(fMet)-specific endonuclease VapC
VKYLLDTNACVAHLRSAGRSKVSQRLASITAGDVVLCTVVSAELLYGAHRSADAARTWSR